MVRPGSQGEGRRLAVRHAAVSVVGFAVDAALLHLARRMGLEPAWARVVSLAAAMQVTFVLNGLHVFKSLALRRWPRQWAAYMVTNAVGNFCNYWIFVTMVSTHWPVVSAPFFALSVASMIAWGVNFTAARLFVFRRAAAAIRDGP